MSMRMTDCAAEEPISSPLKPVVYTLYTRIEVDVPGPPCVMMSIIGKVSKKAYMTFTTSRKKVVGDSKGKTMDQNRLMGPAPSMAAASNSERGMAWSPARKNTKL